MENMTITCIATAIKGLSLLVVVGKSFPCVQGNSMAAKRKPNWTEGEKLALVDRRVAKSQKEL